MPFSKRRSDLVVDERIPSRNHSAARRKLDEMFRYDQGLLNEMLRYVVEV